MSGKRVRPRNRRGQFCRPGEEDGTGAPGPKPDKAAKAWSKDKEAAFFRKLGLLSDLGRALQEAGLPTDASEVQQRLETDPQFRARWSAALAAGYALLELEMQARARNDKRPAPKSALEKKLRAVPNSIALQLLKLHHGRLKGQAGNGAAPQARPLLNAREVRKRLQAKLSDFNRRMGGEG